MSDFARHMAVVAHALLGKPTRIYRHKREWRYGSKGSLSIDLVKGTYFDHEAKIGGGVLDLIKREKGLSGADAIRFLSDLGCDLTDGHHHTYGRNGSNYAPSYRRVVAATFDYVSETGQLLFQTVRYNFRRADGSLMLAENGKPKKAFLQRRPHPTNHGEWIWNLDGVRQVPYRLVELNEAAANERLIVVVEGEAKVDLLWKWNIAATCNAQGSKKWGPEHSEVLRAADVLILPDHDPAGQEHANLVGASLQGVAARVRVLELPGLPPKGDIVDWATAGGSAEEFWQLVEHAPDWKPRNGDQSGERVDQPSIRPTLYHPCDPNMISPRIWIYGRHMSRGAVSCTVAAGGIGKTIETLAEYLALCTGKNLLGTPIPEKLRCWFISLEEPRLELIRRIEALRIHYRIRPEEVGDRLFVDGVDTIKFTIATEGRTGIHIAQPVISALTAAIRENKIDAVTVDPLLRSHAVNENDNAKIGVVVEQYLRIAQETSCAIDLSHHVRKGAMGQTFYTVDDARGASALVFHTRSARALNTMSEKEAETAGIEAGQRRFYFRIDNGKSNYAPPPERSEWRKIESVDLGNARDGYPSDQVPVVTAWDWPSPFEDVTVTDLREIQKRIAAGTWKASAQAKDWAGLAVAEVLALNPNDPGAKEQIKGLLRTWIKNKVLTIVTKTEATSRRSRPYIEVGEWVTSETVFKWVKT
jgi:AAA domain